MRNTFSTTITICDEHGETDHAVMVTYETHAGYRGDYYQPPEPPSVEITGIKAKGGTMIVPDHFYEDEGLIRECFDDWKADLEEAAEWKAQSRRDMMMGGF